MSNLPQKRKNAPPAKKSNIQNQNTNGLFSSITEGIIFGMGTSFGSNIVNGIYNRFSKGDDNKCNDILKKFEKCKKNYGSIKEEWNNDTCIDFFEEYKKCLTK
jgi:hypothetical protein